MSDLRKAAEQAIKDKLDQFERSASQLVSADYALGYREAFAHVIEALDAALTEGRK